MACLVEVTANVVPKVFAPDGGKMTLESFYNWVTGLAHVLFLADFAVNAVNQIITATGHILFASVATACFGAHYGATLVNQGAIIAFYIAAFISGLADGFLLPI